MFRPMRRKNQLLSHEETIQLLQQATSGVLAVSGEHQYPYAVPLSFLYEQNKIYFHCAPEGHKLDAIANNPKVSFCVIAQDDVKPTEYTTYYRSVIVFGTARILQATDEKRHAIELLAAKYTPDDKAGRQEEIDKAFSRLTMVEIAIDHMTGKQAKELRNA